MSDRFFGFASLDGFLIWHSLTPFTLFKRKVDHTPNQSPDWRFLYAYPPELQALHIG